MKKRKITALVVDDELKGRESLSMLLSEYCSSISEIYLSSNVSEAIDIIEKQHPQIVFLDINMPNETGFDLLDKVGDRDFEVIFTTAHAEYAIAAIKQQAMDYLLKPIDLKELIEAVDKAKLKIESKKSNEHLFEVFKSISTDRKEDARISLPMSDSIEIVRCSEILYCEASGNYTIFNLKSGKKHVVSKSLKEYESALPNQMFFRIHHSFIINTEEIVRYSRGDGGYVTLTNGQELMVSKRRKEDFLRFVGIKPIG